MSESLPDFKANLGDLVEELYPEPATHPPVDQWIAYYGGKIRAPEEDELQDHLLRCGDCLQLLESLDSFATIDEEAGRDFDDKDDFDDFETTVTWRLVRQRLAAEGHAIGVAKTPPPDSIETKETSRPWQRIAACLGFFAIGLMVWGTLQQQRIKTLTEPQPNPRSQLIYSAPDRGTTGVEELRFPPGVESLLVHLVVPGGAPKHIEYRVEILDSKGRSLWRGRIEPDRQQPGFPLLLSRGFLREGRSSLRLFGVVQGEQELIEEFPIRVLKQ